MKKSINFKNLLTLVIIFTGGVALLIINLLLTEVNERESQAINVPLFSMLTLLTLTTLAMAINIYARQGHYMIISIAILVFYGLSLRSVIFHPAVAEISEYWLGIPIRSMELNEFNEKKYCVRLSFLFVEVHSTETNSSFTFFRGLWPAYFSNEQIEKGISPLFKCLPPP